MRILFVFTIISSVLSVVTAAPPTYYLLVIQWPRSFCKSVPQIGVGACEPQYLKSLKDSFTIHGLWPQKKPSCQQGLFNSKGFVTLAGLHDKWPNVTSLNTPAFSNGDLMFWEHEWNKHGRCQATRKQTPYFQFVLDTYDKTLMIREEIIKVYLGKLPVLTPIIIKHVETKFQIKVDIKCKPDADKTNPHKLLHEVYFNVSLSGAIQNMTTQPQVLYLNRSVAVAVNNK